MKQIFILILLTTLFVKGICQDFKYLKPNLTDSTEIVKKEINSLNQFERIYYIDYRKNSELKMSLINFGLIDKNSAKSLNQTFTGILKNMATKPNRKLTPLPEKWVKIFKYKNNWILYNDLPKYSLTDSCLITFPMDDPYPSIIADYKNDNQKYEFRLLSYNWENPEVNINETLEIKIVDEKRKIFLWKFSHENQITYSLMIPTEYVKNFPVMNILTTDSMGDEDEIFDKMDYRKYE